MSNNTTQKVNQTIQPSIEYKHYNETTQYITDNLKQKHEELNQKFQEPQVQEKWGQAKNIFFERTKEFGNLSLDYIVKTFEITKITFTELHGLYHK
ncbi:unnamed protein product [Paramecium sonneborni]|uniref:Uncharacterized protein n=1 Tax=Paramecium sonneborni TaxID=65129 RepID=A0A8S1N9V7_9CILI|nr:unnamed protein product [Paramecium sonneborni]